MRIYTPRRFAPAGLSIRSSLPGGHRDTQSMMRPEWIRRRPSLYRQSNRAYCVESGNWDFTVSALSGLAEISCFSGLPPSSGGSVQTWEHYTVSKRHSRRGLARLPC